MRCSCFANEHQVQDAFVLLPTGTAYRGTAKRDAMGKVLVDSIAHLMLACEREAVHPRP